MTDLTALIARVEQATRDDVKLIRAAAELLIRPLPGVEYHDEWWARFELKLGAHGFLDAAVALCERVLPGWGWGVAVIEARVTAMLVEPDTPDASLMDPWPRRFESAAPTPALALLLALLRAVQAQKQETT